MVTKFEGTAPGGWRRRIVEMISDPLRGGANWLIPGERFDIPSSLPVNRISKELTGYNLDELSEQDTVDIIPTYQKVEEMARSYGRNTPDAIKSQVTRTWGDTQLVTLDNTDISKQRRLVLEIRLL